MRPLDDRLRRAYIWCTGIYNPKGIEGQEWKKRLSMVQLILGILITILGIVGFILVRRLRENKSQLSQT
jgi:hypothetical protein